ncbi:MAG: hypothetical protein OHK0038_28160 [Flammeovirgaceae bacterium]
MNNLLFLLIIISFLIGCTNEKEGIEYDLPDEYDKIIQGYLAKDDSIVGKNRPLKGVFLIDIVGKFSEKEIILLEKIIYKRSLREHLIIGHVKYGEEILPIVSRTLDSLVYPDKELQEYYINLFGEKLYPDDAIITGGQYLMITKKLTGEIQTIETSVPPIYFY